MANLKRNSIKLMKEIKGEEIITETYWTVPFPSLAMVYEAADIVGAYEELQLERKKNEEIVTSKEVGAQIEKMAEFLADRVYGKQFTKEELAERFYGPDSFGALQDQVLFVATGAQNDETKKFLEKKG